MLKEKNNLVLLDLKKKDLKEKS